MSLVSNPSQSPADNFRPTSLQLRFLRYIQGEPTYQSVREICQSVGVDPSTYYKWCHDPGFRAWLVREWSSALLFEGWHVLNLARRHMVLSATHFKAIHSLLFEAKGQAAIASWQQNLVAATTPEASCATDPTETSSRPGDPQRGGANGAPAAPVERAAKPAWRSDSPAGTPGARVQEIVEMETSADQPDSSQNSTPTLPPSPFPVPATHDPELAPGKIAQHLASLLKTASAPPPSQTSGRGGRAG